MKNCFGKTIKELRTKNRIKQSDLATVMNVSKTTISQWETSKQEPCIDDILRLAEYFNVSVDSLLYGETKTVTQTETEELIQLYNSLMPSAQEVVMETLRQIVIKQNN